ncbi:hypothetical protein ABVV53_14770 [Novosphingobium sp. RD2P27]|uniref:Lipoprotein n=1 Tax=Novosphingobium kalidii TaxID=3230299 RepID=A0ABV2D4R8_9SPHN
MLKKIKIAALGGVVCFSLSGCAALLGAGAGAAAATYYNDENDVCDAPTEAGVLDDDC